MKKNLRAGTSIIDISPELGVELAGYPHYPRYNTGIHDPLYASCIYLNDGITKLAVVCMDLVMFSNKYADTVCNKIASKTDIPAKNIMITCSHTHSGPWASGMLDLEALRDGSKPDEKYIEELENKLVKLFIEAHNNNFNAKIGIEKGYCGKESGVGGNRRDPNGLADPEVWVIGVQDEESNWKACLVKYSLHPTVIHEGSTLVTADYPAYIRQKLSETKPGMTFLFAQGTSGNQSTRYFRSGQTFDEAKRIGTAIGSEADRVLSSMKLSSDIELFVKSTEIDVEIRALPSRKEAEAHVIQAKKKYEELKAVDAPYIEIQNAYLELLGAEDTLGYVIHKECGRKLELIEDELPAEVQVIGIGDTRIVGLPGEIFVEFGLEIKDRSKYKNTFVIELANGCLPGYACTKEAYDVGGYEPGASILTAQAGKALVEAALKLIEKT